MGARAKVTTEHFVRTERGGVNILTPLECAMEEILLIVFGLALYLVWLLVAAICKFIFRLVASMWNDLTGETERRRRREQEARKKVEEARMKEDERKEREKERQRKRRQAEATERQRFRAENKEVFTGIRHLLSACADPAVEIMRAVGAIEGNYFECVAKLVIWLDVGYILASVRRTGSGNDYIEKLWEEVTRAIKPPNVDGQPSLDVVPNRAVEQLGLVLLLAEYDTRRGTTLTSKAASVYRHIVTAVYDHCDGSLAAKMVADKYIELLSPYIRESGGNGYAGNSSSSAGSHSNMKSVCDKCVKGYQLLDLPFSASEDEVKQKRGALAQVLHSDHTGGMSKRTRDTAEGQLKSINVAYDHILKCRFSGTAS